MNLHALEDEIFAQYRNHCEQCAQAKALPDGCPDPDLFLNAGLRVLFVLKEAHGWEKESGNRRDLRRFARDGGAYKTWGNLARWCSLVLDPTFTIDKLDASNAYERSRALSHCCFVNLKKVPGKTRSVQGEISTFARQHVGLLKKQFSLYKPHLTITCGTFVQLKELYCAIEESKPEVQDGFHFFKEASLGTVIDFYHPQYFKISPTEYLRMLRSNLVFHFPERFH